MPDSLCGIIEILTNLYFTPTLRQRGTWGDIVRIKIQSNVIVSYLTLFYAENCARLLDFFANRSWGGVLQPNKLASDKKVIMEETVA